MYLFRKITHTGTFHTFFMAVVLAIFIFLPSSMVAQEPAPQVQPVQEFPYAPEYLLRFFDANQEISRLNRATQDRLNQTVAERNLTMERFNQIARAAQIGELQVGVFTEEEIAAFNEVAPKITTIQREMVEARKIALDAKDLTLEKYQEILADFRQNQALQEHVRNLLRERARQAAREARDREQQQTQQQTPPQGQ